MWGGGAEEGEAVMASSICVEHRNLCFMVPWTADQGCQGTTDRRLWWRPQPGLTSDDGPAISLRRRRGV